MQTWVRKLEEISKINELLKNENPNWALRNKERFRQFEIPALNDHDKCIWQNLSIIVFVFDIFHFYFFLFFMFSPLESILQNLLLNNAYFRLFCHFTVSILYYATIIKHSNTKNKKTRTKSFDSGNLYRIRFWFFVLRFVWRHKNP